MALQTSPAAIPNSTAGWWPSRYGAEDEAGVLNEITPGKELDAVGLVRQGLVYDLSGYHYPGGRLGINALRVADHIAGRLGVTGQQQARPEPAAAHA